MQKVAETLGTSQFFTFPYVEKPRGQVEDSVKTLKIKLRAIITDLKGIASS